jgi:hypothetical protein
MQFLRRSSSCFMKRTESKVFSIFCTGSEIAKRIIRPTSTSRNSLCVLTGNVIVPRKNFIVNRRKVGVDEQIRRLSVEWLLIVCILSYTGHPAYVYMS